MTCEEKKPDNYIRFMDGHLEAITWWDNPSHDTVFVMTESGRYQYYHDGCIPRFSKFSVEKICYETVVDIIYMVVGGEQFGIKPKNSTVYVKCELTKDDVLEPSEKTIEELIAESCSSFTIKDSGDRTQFASGAVRDMHEGKGRMDLLPWAAIMEVSKHCENGAKKYGEHNVDRGIPTHSLCDSAARHLAKYLDGWDDEPHLVAAAWNLLWAIQMTVKNPAVVDTPWSAGRDDKN